VRQFVELARDGFYDGTRFHRVVKGLLVQGGDPNSRDEDPLNDGTGGPGVRLKPEFNDLPHERGALSMARDPKDPDSAGSQFFLMQGKAPAYDRQYTVFGRIEQGLEVLDRIGAVRVKARQPGAVPELPETDVWLKRALVLGVRR
jgi:cyclophilin family peptidyl-prolyl cis-trans isomerase